MCIQNHQTKRCTVFLCKKNPKLESFHLISIDFLSVMTKLGIITSRDLPRPRGTAVTVLAGPGLSQKSCWPRWAAVAAREERSPSCLTPSPRRRGSGAVPARRRRCRRGWNSELSLSHPSRLGGLHHPGAADELPLMCRCQTQGPSETSSGHLL